MRIIDYGFILCGLLLAVFPAWASGEGGLLEGGQEHGPGVHSYVLTIGFGANDLRYSSLEPFHAVVEETRPSVIAGEPPVVVEESERLPRVLVKSNVLYLAASVLNAGAEVRLSRHLSLDVPVTWSPYTIAPKYRIRTLSVQPELRWWFDTTFREGHFVGLHAHLAGFNIAFNNNRFQDSNHALWGVGVSYGYFLPIPRSRWSVEFTVGAGYASIDYDVYESTGQGYYLRSGKKDYWGVTRLGVSFGYCFY